MSLAEIGEMDMLSFRALTASVIRVHYTMKSEDAWTRMIAAQGEHRTMDRWVEGWRKLAGIKPKKKNADDFVKAFGTRI